MEEWHERIFEVMHRDADPNSMPVTMHQLKEADKMLFGKMTEQTCGKLTMLANGTKPMEAALKIRMDCAEVQFCLIPMVKAAGRPAVQDGPSSPKGKLKGKGEGKVRKELVKPYTSNVASQLPPNCSQMAPEKLKRSPFATLSIDQGVHLQNPANVASVVFTCVGSVSSQDRTAYVITLNK